MNAARTLRCALALAGLALAALPASAQFRDDFDGPLRLDPEGINGWSFFTGEGRAVMDLKQGPGYASIIVDATKDTRGVWWALIKRRVSAALDLSKLKDPAYSLRVEARIRVSEAPRRVNLHVNTQRTTDFHSHLMEYDIPDTNTWHTISMTTHGFDAGPGDAVNAQMALMDWGLGRYQVDIDYYEADIVKAAEAGPDLGDPIPYHPPVPDPASFREAVPALEAGMIDLENPGVNFDTWGAAEDAAGEGRIGLLTASGSQVVILRWDLSAFAGRSLPGPGLLEMTTYSVAELGRKLPDFGEARVVEIVGGDPAWRRETVTAESLRRGLPLDKVILPQMIIDWPVAEGRGARTYFVISRPALKRLIDGKSLGIAIKPLGALGASFFADADVKNTNTPRLLFNIGR
jgi:hypothetical protein